MPERYISSALRNNRRLPTIQGTLTGVEAAIHDRIWNAILDRKLRPGAKLHEDMVGNTFGVSRTIVRKVFLIMEQEGIISLPLNRGAFVAVPTPDEIKHLFETMRLVMPHIMRSLAVTLDDEMKARLETHFETDQEQDQRVSRRLAHEYFILLADVHGNPIIAGLVERIATRTSMALTLYQDQMSDWHPADYGRRINKAIMAGDSETAIKIFFSSLEELEKTLLLEGPDSTFDIGSILSAGEDTVYPKARRSSKTRTRRTKAELEGTKKKRSLVS